MNSSQLKGMFIYTGDFGFLSTHNNLEIYTGCVYSGMRAAVSKKGYNLLTVFLIYVGKHTGHEMISAT